jgi:hypothetical protein
MAWRGTTICFCLFLEKELGILQTFAAYLCHWKGSNKITWQMTPHFGLVWSCSGQNLAVSAPEHSNESAGCVKTWECTECWATIIFSCVHSCYIDIIDKIQKFIITKIPPFECLFGWMSTKGYNAISTILSHKQFNLLGPKILLRDFS